MTAVKMCEEFDFNITIANTRRKTDFSVHCLINFTFMWNFSAIQPEIDAPIEA